MEKREMPPPMRPSPPSPSRLANPLARPVKPAAAAEETGPAGFKQDPVWVTARDNPMRRMGFYIALVFIFFRFSLLHELMTVKLGFNTYILYIMGPPSLFFLLISGGFPRALRSTTAKFWIAFTIWLLLCVPFSFWPGGSWPRAQSFMRTEIPMMLLVAGMAVTISDCMKIVAAVSMAAVFNVYMAYTFDNDDVFGRFNIAFSSIANANDMAAHLLLVLPILAYYVIGPKKNILIRLGGGGLIALGLYLIFGTGSRGAMVSLLMMVLMVLWRGTGIQRIMIVVVAPVAFLAITPFLPRLTVNRLLTVFNTQEEEEETKASRAKRMYLLTQSLKHTITHPIFGVGPDQFINFDGTDAVSNNRLGPWQVSHNAYTQVSSETGIPGISFMIGGLLGTFLILNQLVTRLRKARDCLEVRQLRLLCFLLLLSQVSFCCSIFFLSLAYRFYLPFLSGLVIALRWAIQNELPLIEKAAAAKDTRRPAMANRPAAGALRPA